MGKYLQSYGNSFCPETIHADVTTDAIFLFDEAQCGFDIVNAFGAWQNRSRFFGFIVYEKNSVVFCRQRK